MVLKPDICQSFLKLEEIITFSSTVVFISNGQPENVVWSLVVLYSTLLVCYLIMLLCFCLSLLPIENIVETSF